MKETQSTLRRTWFVNNTAVSLSQLKLPPNVSSTIYSFLISLSPLAATIN